MMGNLSFKKKKIYPAHLDLPSEAKYLLLGGAHWSREQECGEGW